MDRKQKQRKGSTSLSGLLPYSLSFLSDAPVNFDIQALQAQCITTNLKAA